MTFHGAEGFNSDDLEGAQYVVTANNGFRAWAADLDNGLKSLCFPYFWKPGLNRASNGRYAYFGSMAKEGEGDPYPTKTNSMGFYAYYDEAYYQPGMYGNTVRVNGMIEGFGHCVVGGKGFRAELAIITAIALPIEPTQKWLEEHDMDVREAQDAVVAMIEKRYPTVPIFESPTDMFATVPLKGRPDRF